MSSDIHNVFVSHRHEDDALVEGLKVLLAGHNVNVRDSSITTDRPNRAQDEAYIKAQILAPGIRWAGKLIVIISPETMNHPYVDWEIEYAERCDKPIIGVWAPGADGCDLPAALEEHADSLVAWDAADIIAALEDGQCWEEPDGSPRPKQPVSRLGC